MKWQEILRGSVEYQYAVADNLMKMVDDSELDWKPATGSNWMTVGQLLKHITEACGLCFKGFVTGDWGFPDGVVDMKDLPPEALFPPAEKMPTVSSVEEARKLLAEDKKVAIEMLDSCGNDKLETEITKAPWDEMEFPLGQRLFQMVMHLNQHKGQLFYYLKLQGKPVNTGHLWGD